MKALVLFSGGVDSSTCLALAVEKYGSENVIALSISYGQKHEREIESAEAIAKHYNVKLMYINLAKLFLYSDSSLLSHSDKEIPHEEYAAQLEKTHGTPVSTYVPFRNGLFLATAANIAISKGCEVIYYGAHSDDAAGNAYPDCSDVFNDAMNKAIYEGSGRSVHIEAPFVNLNKAGIVREGLRLKVPYEYSWSCYEGDEKPCCKCGTCLDRIKAFKENGVDDPLLVKYKLV
ncbi:MAG: 7-cyano-7-deazaguanine synthase QueC [Lachnospiraceae bacterium]|nr:7-cyano-7-deazaguanine synthase QueC [Lachnospiraceae bacterium]